MMVKKMTVWVIGNGIPTEDNPMLSQFSYMQAKMVARYHDVNIVYLAIDLRSIRRKRPFRIVFKKDNMEIVYWSFPLGAVPRKVLEFVGYKTTRSALKYCIKKYGEPDIIHTHFCEMGYNVSRNKDLFQKSKIIHTEHWSALIREDVSKGNKRIADYTYHNVDKIIAVSEALKDRIKKDYGVDAIYIPNMIDETVFNTDNNNISNETAKEYKFISVGRLTYQKNHEGLIQAFNKAFNADEHVKLLIVGEGEDRSTLEELIKQLNRPEDILLLGQKNHEQIASLFKESDCFVLFSRFETFGVVYVEANMCGLPVIATHCGGPESIVNNTNGIIIDNNDEKQLIDAFIFMKNHSIKYDRKKISSTARDLFSCKSVSNKIVAAYREL